MLLNAINRAASIWEYATLFLVYIDLGGDAGGTATLAFAFNAMDANRMFDIKITQLECDNPSA